MPKYCIVATSKNHHEEVHLNPQKDWPIFADGHSLMDWYGRQAAKINDSRDYRDALVTLQRYLRANRQIDFTEHCWARFLQVKNEQGNPMWYLRTFNMHSTPWASRENDMLFLGMVTPKVFGKREISEDMQKYLQRIEKPLPRKVVQRVIRNANVKSPKGKFPVVKTERTRLNGRPLLAPENPPRRISLNDQIYGPGGGPGLPHILAWIVSRQDLFMDLPEQWTQLYKLASSWIDDPVAYWKKLSNEFDSSSHCYVVACTYHLLERGFKPSFVRQAEARLPRDEYANGFLFKAKTVHRMWSEGDWTPRKPKESPTWYRTDELSGGLRLAFDSTWLRSTRVCHPRFGFMLNLLPEYAVNCLLIEALSNADVVNFEGAWNYFPRLPFETREVCVRNIMHKEGYLWHLNHHLYGEDDNDGDLALHTFLHHILPEYSDLWDLALGKGTTLEEAICMLDVSRQPLAQAEHVMPADLAF